MSLNILYEDNHIIVCIKPAGTLSQASDLNMPDMLTDLKAYIKEKYNKPGQVFCGLVHRLDLNVGGVMVFARTSKAAKRLSQQIREHQFNKHYFAVTRGDSGHLNQNVVLENHLKKDQKNRKAIITDRQTDQYAKLIYQTLEKVTVKDELLSLVDIELITGRFHQIRAQFANQHLSLYGDNKYGKKTAGYELGLYAYALNFRHPVSKEELTFYHYPNEGIFKQFKLLNGREKNDS
jgi:23S rRNA pseudouridine1911/1915/1917 synthase